MLMQPDTSTLLFLDDLLCRCGCLETFEQGELDEIQTLLEGVIEKCTSSEIDERLKVFLLSRLYELEFAIKNFEVFGLDYFRNQVILATANVKFVKDAQMSPVPEPFFDAFFKWVERVHALVQLVPLLPGIVDSATKLIGS